MQLVKDSHDQIRALGTPLLFLLLCLHLFLYCGLTFIQTKSNQEALLPSEELLGCVLGCMCMYVG
jgi:hypothetical protein